MKRKVAALTPFALSSDFSAPTVDAPPEEHPDEIRLTHTDLATLLEHARSETAELVRNDILAQEAEKLALVSTQMQSALSQIVDLAAHLEKAHFAELDRALALDSVRKLASTLLDGQGDLFEEN